MDKFLITFFTLAPLTVIPMLDTNSRMDMIDLMDAGMPAIVGNRYGGESTLIESSDSLLGLELTDVSYLELTLLPDSTFCLEHHVTTSDSVVHSTRKYYTADYKEIKK